MYSGDSCIPLRSNRNDMYDAGMTGRSLAKGRQGGRIRLKTGFVNSLQRVTIYSLILISCGGATQRVPFEIPDGHQLTEAMKIEIPPGQNREFSYTNKQSAFYYGYTNGYNDRFFQGLTDYRKKLFDDYYLFVDDQALHRSEAKTTVYFHQLVRNHEGISEAVTLLDDKTVLLIDVKGGHRLTLAPVFPDDKAQYNTEWDDARDILFVTKNDWLTLPDEPGMPRWLGISMGSEGAFQNGTPAGVPADKIGIGSLSVTSDGQRDIVIAADHDRKTVARLIEEILQTPERYVRRKRERLENLQLQTYVHTDNADLNKALSWAKVSMDALVMNQDKRGIFAGLPWFNDYWGRDTFISLPGALLVTGQFDRAREILLDFGSFQLTDEADSLYGRIPNRIRPDEVIYNTADGTPWFVREAYEYLLYSGDTTFASMIFPVVKRSIEGTVRYRLDRNGFLQHDAADTWMDAKIEGTIPWSSRGDRACDIQALWFTQLIAGAKLAELVGDTSAVIEEWLDLADEVRRNFFTYFIASEDSCIYDHLDPEGPPDHQYRPNQIFCLTVPFSNSFPRESPFASLNGGLGHVHLDRFSKRLVYPFGVGSLWKTEENFHPYHHHPNYHFDASYHNGIVWTWVSGPVVTAFCRQGRTFVPHVLFDALTEQILVKGAVGTISELIDAAPKPGRTDPELTGTFTQAWSLAEYLRNFYQDFLGVYPLSDKYGLRFSPSGVLHYFGTIRFILRTKLGPLQCMYDIDKKRLDITAVDLIGALPVNVAEKEYILSSGEQMSVPLGELNREPEDASKLAAPEVPENTPCLQTKDYLETKLRNAWRMKTDE